MNDQPGKWIIAEDGRPYYTERGKKLALVGYVHAGEAEGSAEDALVDVLHRLTAAENECERLRTQIDDETRTTDELLDKLMDGEGELREHLRTLGEIVIDLANHPDPSYDYRQGDVICRFCHYVPGMHEPGRHVPGCVWRRAREAVREVASR